MSSTFLYFASERLSSAELTGARLDGDLVEIGEAFMPTDAVETPELRAASLRASIPETVAVTRQTAAWLHGATAAAPARHTVQRRVAVRGNQVIDPRLEYRGHLVEQRYLTWVGCLWATTPAYTLTDLIRAHCAGEDTASAVASLLAWRPELAAEAQQLLEDGRAVHHKRPALAFLRAVRTT
ncbi:MULTISPECIES: SAM-dependent methyltransferase [unclassified Microbacterium]|uniref:SAM-dependent methyltransferase n=1 Tax=unclassified Microbacterium TaxID=2609290 RepID=UPI000AE271D8|nr:MULTISPECIES: SAM-dependent methyltransferase [unclassified Microbacterium]